MADNEFMDETMTRAASTQGWKQVNKWSGKPSKKRQWLDRVKKDLAPKQLIAAEQLVIYKNKKHAPHALSNTFDKQAHSGGTWF